MELFVRPQRMQRILAAVAVFLLFATTSQAQFRFNFSASGGSVVGNIANQSCGGGAGGGMGGMGGACDGTPFLQEVLTIGGSDYYHVIVGNGSGEFGIEYYMRTSGMCWWGCSTARVTGGMGGGMGGGGTPLSSSFGSATDDSAPLSNRNSGVGAPNRVAIRQFNNTGVMSQEFLKATETQKPKITQIINDPAMNMNFSVDMSNSTYSDMNATAKVGLTQNVPGTGAPAPGTNPATGKPFQSSENFNIDDVGPTAVRENTAGRFTYTAGGNDGGSMGTYNYFADSYDVYNVNWQSFCQPSQNPASNCTSYGGVRGGMGGAAGGGMMAVAAASAPRTSAVPASNTPTNSAIPATTFSTPTFITTPIVPPTTSTQALSLPPDPFASLSTPTASTLISATTSTSSGVSTVSRSTVTTSTATTRFVR